MTTSPNLQLYDLHPRHVAGRRCASSWRHLLMSVGMFCAVALLTLCDSVVADCSGQWCAAGPPSGDLLMSRREKKTDVSLAANICINLNKSWELLGWSQLIVRGQERGRGLPTFTGLVSLCCWSDTKPTFYFSNIKRPSAEINLAGRLKQQEEAAVTAAICVWLRMEQQRQQPHAHTRGAQK